MEASRQIEFNRPKKYRLIKDLGSGSCGRTILVYDDEMACNFVIKKFSPSFDSVEHPELHLQLLDRFKNEARLLFQVNHPYVVRVFNFTEYREAKTAYIVQEYVDGTEILAFCRENPLEIEAIFSKCIDAFRHLEERSVLHRDIRPSNILVDRTGDPRVVDFGFGKLVIAEDSVDEKSISLNWWCEVPPEFSRGTYDWQTEVYFLGKLFELILSECGLREFRYRGIVERMCEKVRSRRFTSFKEVSGAVSRTEFEDVVFSNDETTVYRNFSSVLRAALASIYPDAKYERDAEKLLENLRIIYRTNQLESEVQDFVRVLRAFLHGGFSYYTSASIDTSLLKDFIILLSGLPSHKRLILLENIHSRMDEVPRRSNRTDDEIPF